MIQGEQSVLESGVLDPGVLEDAGEAVNALRDLPIGAHSVVIFGLIAGLLIWAFGRHFLKTGFALVGVMLGAAVGLFGVGAAPVVDRLPESLPVPAPYIGLGVGALIGLIVAVLLFRVVMAASTALIMAIIGVLASAIYLDLKLDQPGNEPQELATEELWLQGPEEVEGWAPFDFGVDEEPGQAERVAVSATVKTRRFVRALSNELKGLWERLPEQSQLVVALSAALGAAIGALSGLAAPKRASGAITAMLGAALWLPCLIWLANARDLPGRELLMGHRPIGYATMWLGAAALGIMVQWIAVRATSKKPAEEGN